MFFGFLSLEGVWDPVIERIFFRRIIYGNVFFRWEGSGALSVGLVLKLMVGRIICSVLSTSGLRRFYDEN